MVNPLFFISFSSRHFIPGRGHDKSSDGACEQLRKLFGLDELGDEGEVMCARVIA